MAAPATPPHDDEGEALFWLQMAKCILAGDIAPRAARAALKTTAVERAAGAITPPIPITRH